MRTGQTRYVLVNMETNECYYSKTFAGLGRAAEISTARVKYMYKKRRAIKGFVCLLAYEITLDRVQNSNLKRF